MGDKVDSVLAIGSTFDWISPLLAFTQDIRHGSAYNLHIQWPCGMSGRQVEGLLRENGLETWGAMIVSDTLLITVKDEQAAHASEILQQSNVPLLNPAGGVGKERRGLLGRLMYGG